MSGGSGCSGCGVDLSVYSAVAVAATVSFADSVTAVSTMACLASSAGPGREISDAAREAHSPADR